LLSVSPFTHIDISQAQLRQALSHATAAGWSASHVQPPNTPTQSISVLSYSNAESSVPRSKHQRGHRGTRSKAASFSMIPGEPEDLMMIDEEQEVEGLLDQQSPLSSSLSSHCHAQCAFPNHFAQQCPSHMSPTSSFTTTDPFYVMSAQPHQTRQFVAPQNAFFQSPQK
jgi:hypothetical protein